MCRSDEQIIYELREENAALRGERNNAIDLRNSDVNKLRANIEKLENDCKVWADAEITLRNTLADRDLRIEKLERVNVLVSENRQSMFRMLREDVCEDIKEALAALDEKEDAS